MYHLRLDVTARMHVEESHLHRLLPDFHMPQEVQVDAGHCAQLGEQRFDVVLGP